MPSHHSETPQSEPPAVSSDAVTELPQQCKGRAKPQTLVHSTMASSGTRVLLRLPRAGALPRLRTAEAAWQRGRRSLSGVAIARQPRGQVYSSRGLTESSSAGPSRRRSARGLGRFDGGLLLPMQTARCLTSGAVSGVAAVDVIVLRMMACGLELRGRFA